MTNNGTLPTYLLFTDPTGKWHLADSHGNLLYDNLNLSRDTLAGLVNETGRPYKVIDPQQHKKKGNP
jgi:hypothetical protein